MSWLIPVAAIGLGFSLLLCKLKGEASESKQADIRLEELEAADRAWCAARRQVDTEDSERLLAGRPRLTLADYLGRFPQEQRLQVLQGDQVARLLREREGDKSSLVPVTVQPPQAQPAQVNQVGLI